MSNVKGKELLFFTNSKRKRLPLNSAPYKSVGTTTRRLHGRSSIRLEAAACNNIPATISKSIPARSGQTRPFRLEPNHVVSARNRMEKFRIEFLVLLEKNFITRSKRFPCFHLSSPEFHRLLCYFARIKTSNLGVKGRGQAISPSSPTFTCPPPNLLSVPKEISLFVSLPVIAHS